MIEPPEDQDRFKDWMSVLITLVALLTAITAWRASEASRSANEMDFQAITATLNAQEALALGTAQAIQHLSAFARFAATDEYATRLRADARTANAETGADLVLEATIMERLAATNRNFFPARYAELDGTYDLSREVGESLADAARQQSLDPASYLEQSDVYGEQAIEFTRAAGFLAASLLLFTLAVAFHPARKGFRYGTALVGLVVLLISIVLLVILELRA